MCGLPRPAEGSIYGRLPVATVPCRTYGEPLTNSPLRNEVASPAAHYASRLPFGVGGDFARGAGERFARTSRPSKVVTAGLACALFGVVFGAKLLRRHRRLRSAELGSVGAPRRSEPTFNLGSKAASTRSIYFQSRNEHRIRSHQAPRHWLKSLSTASGTPASACVCDAVMHAGLVALAWLWVASRRRRGLGAGSISSDSWP